MKKTKVSMIGKSSKQKGKVCLSAIGLESFVQKIRKESKQKPVSKLRTELEVLAPNARSTQARLLPQVIPALECCRGKGAKGIKCYNGIVELTVAPLKGEAEINLIKQRAWEIPQTLCAFVGASGKSVKIWCRVTYPDQTLPEEVTMAENFHAQAYELAVKCYQPHLPYAILPQKPTMHHSSRLSFDPEILYRPHAVPFILTQPTRAFVLQTEEFMQRHYEFRFNNQLGEVEYRDRNNRQAPFQLIDTRALNSMALDAQKEGIALWDKDIKRYVYSNRVPLYNPLEAYLHSLPHWDGTDRIRPLAASVPCDHPDWIELFHRWFLSLVAHWMFPDLEHANCVSPLLVGAQGTRKSTFCRHLMAPEIRSFYTDSIDFTRKRDAELSLNRFALINIDEFDQISNKEQAFLKHILQKPVVNIRKPHGCIIKEMRRYASFIGTSNQMDLLTDPSGSRRFICIEVTKPIETTHPLCYKQLYAQALYEVEHGARYWFDSEDERRMMAHNRAFEKVSPEEELFYRYFTPAAMENEQGEWMLASEILSVLQDKGRIPYSQKGAIVFGRILRKQPLLYKRSKSGMVYFVRRIG